MQISVAFTYQLSLLLLIGMNVETSKILKVPYKVQPTNNTCQSTCMKMLGMYYGVSNISTKDPRQIYKEINEGSKRPDKSGINSWTNIVWWLNTEIPDKNFVLFTTNDEARAIEYLVKSIDDNHPVLLSTNHFRTTGHLVTVVGYKNYVANQSNATLRFICHDPYGKFFPDLLSEYFGPNRFDFGSSLPNGDEVGPGKGVEILPSSLKRFRDDVHHKGQFVIIGATE